MPTNCREFGSALRFRKDATASGGDSSALACRSFPNVKSCCRTPLDEVFLFVARWVQHWRGREKTRYYGAESPSTVSRATGKGCSPRRKSAARPHLSRKPFRSLRGWIAAGSSASPRKKLCFEGRPPTISSKPRFGKSEDANRPKASGT